MIAVIDIGNTRLKWAVAGTTGLTDSGSAVHVTGIENAVDALVGALPPTVRSALAANVAGPKVSAELAVALRDFLDRVNPLHPYDWMTLVQEAQQITAERVADIVASLTAFGPLVPDEQTPVREDRP